MGLIIIFMFNRAHSKCTFHVRLTMTSWKWWRTNITITIKWEGSHIQGFQWHTYIRLCPILKVKVVNNSTILQVTDMENVIAIKQEVMYGLSIGLFTILHSPWPIRKVKDKVMHIPIAKVTVMETLLLPSNSFQQSCLYMSLVLFKSRRSRSPAQTAHLINGDCIVNLTFAIKFIFFIVIRNM